MRNEDGSLGALSPHSVASTPPPTIHGRMRRVPSNGAPINVAEQLVQMLQMQQQLLSAIGLLARQEWLVLGDQLLSDFQSSAQSY
ncbi:unnamed protein product [Cladocopium goreaui]|uniref:Uncharacterized protein n=1 Tax=Cladocopium goreaui TaxID=2562237 RepID=A0A9P1CSF6_9DINO|nr:unnamed protein product [Cladocopium goreaui]